MIRQETAGDSPSWTLDRSGNRIRALDDDARIEEIASGLTRQEGVRIAPSDATDELVRDHLEAVHDRDYLQFLDAASSVLSHAEPEVDPRWAMPGVKPDTPVGTGVAAAARSAASTALTAARTLQEDVTFTYALCRPPGHHAGRRSMGGYCYLNNAAVAVSYLRAEMDACVGILDIDFHFGNGTAAITADDPGVWLESIHASVMNHFPWRASNPPNARHRYHELDRPPSPRAYLTRLDDALERLIQHCEMLVVSLGYDIVWGDPHGDWSLPPLILQDIGARISAAGLSVCIVQEGGYSKRQLGRCSEAFATGMLRKLGAEVSA